MKIIIGFYLECGQSHYSQWQPILRNGLRRLLSFVGPIAVLAFDQARSRAEN
jgi:hypothetical protein